MILIEFFPCKNRFEAEALERYYTELFNCGMNSNVPGRTQKQYYEDHKDRIQQRQNAKFTCECGDCYTHVNKTVHNRTDKHQNYMEANYEWTYWWDDIQCTEQDYNICHHAY
jgi:hypothetical protein